MSYRTFDYRDYSELARFLMNGYKLYDEKNVDELTFPKSTWSYMLFKVLRMSMDENDRELSREIFDFLLEQR